MIGHRIDSSPRERGRLFRADNRRSKMGKEVSFGDSLRTLLSDLSSVSVCFYFLLSFGTPFERNTLFSFDSHVAARNEILRYRVVREIARAARR